MLGNEQNQPPHNNMTRHFIGLYLLVVLAIAAVSWTQERLWLAYSNQNVADKSINATVTLVERQLHALPASEWEGFIDALIADTGLDIELLAISDVTGKETLAALASNEVVHMQAAGNESWFLKQLDNRMVLTLKQVEPAPQRGLLEWSLAVLLYAGIAFVIMLWLWPLTRDLRALEQATASFGNRNWLFRADIKPRSQVFPLAETFRKMAARIDGLIGSHKDMSNAVSHEIKTPLSRMQFEIELAQNATAVDQMKHHLQNIKSDIADLNALVTATLDYAILERAEVSLNLSAQDFTKIIPAVSEYVQRDARPDLDIRCQVHSAATRVVCDAHLMETVLKNLLYNASRYAQHKVRINFSGDATLWHLTVDDDGPGIPEIEWQRVFGSFVQLGQQLDPASGKKKGFGLGLAIVKRAVEWHGGHVALSRSPLGGAHFALSWPQALRAT